MTWFYVESGQQAGPVEESVLDGLFRAGRIQADTLVWREGLANWQPYREVRPATPLAATPEEAPPVVLPQPGAGNEVVCSECNRIFSADNAIRYGDRWVCAGCKPMFVQKLREGAPLPGLTVPLRRYAGFWIRFAAKFIDNLILGMTLTVPIIILVVWLEASAGPGAEMTMLLFQLLLNLGYLAVYLGFNAFFLARYGATPGKMACSLKVVTAEGEPLTTGRAWGRAAADLLSGMICYIGYTLAAFDEEKRALHDHLCNTRVIYK
jgi:uncharacterized RDD family membrane protein YckC